MKTLKLLILLIATGLLWQQGQAQCATIYRLPGTAPGQYYFAPNISSSDSNTAVFAWNFGDGATSTDKFPDHTFATTGSYNVCLTYTDASCTSTVCDSFYTNTCPPVAAISLTQSTSAGLTSFTLSNVPAGSTFGWSFGSLAVPTGSTNAAPQVTYPASGIYSGYVVVSYGSGCSQYISFNVNTHTTCDASWTYGLAGYAASMASTVPTVPGATYNWYFGDGSVSATGNPVQHTYPGVGTYSSGMAITTAGCTDTVWQNVVVTQPPCPNASTLFTPTILGNEMYEFIPFTPDSVQGSGSFNWTYGDGATWTGFTAQHNYAASGDYTVCLNFVSPYCNVSHCDTISVDICDPVLNINTWGNDSVIYYRVNYANPSWTYQWDFPHGNPSTSTDPMPYIGYSTPGTYTGTVIVTVPGCGTYTDSVQVTLTGANFGCSASFNYNRTTPNTAEFIFADSLVVAPATYRFDYGDGSYGTSLTHTYATSGTYTACLSVNYLTCADTVCIPVTVLPEAGGYIHWTIRKGSGYACKGFVYLIKEDSVGHLALVDSLTFDSVGNCYNSNTFYVSAGSYYLKAGLHSTDPDYADYLPTYFGDELNWADATALNPSSNWNVINLIAGTNPGGPGFIGGYVSEGAGLGVINGNGEERSVGDPIANMQINLLTENDIPVAYAYTDGSGRYTFSNLALGTYKVYAEALSKTPIAQSVTLTANNSSQDNVDVLINSNSAVTDINDIADLKVDAIFPNPVKDKATIRFTAKQNAIATVQVTDVLGNVVSNNTANIITGNNDVIVDLQNKASGVYHVSVINSTNKKIVKLIKAN